MHINNIALALGLASSIAPASAFFRMSCPGRVARERLDPVVSPGVVSGHVHTISGGAGFGPSMTFAQARASKCSSCEIKEDMSNYWTPQLYVNAKNGSFMPVPVNGDGQDTNGGMTVYYLQRGATGEQLKAFPEGFRMLAGDPFKRNFTGGLDAKAVTFNCLGANKPETNNIPNYKCPGGLRAQVFFPSCWNGKDLDSADHKSHVSYPIGDHADSGACPPEFPVHLISIFFEVLYDAAKFDAEWNGDQHPFVFAQGDPTGYGFHGDFVNGWDVNVLQKAVDTCTDNSGSVSKCGAVTMYTADECNQCKLPSVINEQIDGVLEKLPGCNPITRGPDRAPVPANCDDKATIGAPVGNYVDLISSKKWEYTGCGDDSGTRSFTGDKTSSDDMTVEKCVDFCSAAGFSYAGLEFGRECYCDNQLNTSNTPKDGVMGKCTMKCAGNNKEFCGNGGALSIYHKCGATCKNQQIGGGGSTESTPAVSSVVAVAESAAIPVVVKSSTQDPAATPSNIVTTTKTGTAPTSAPVVVSSAAPVPTPTQKLDCPRNNCVNQIFNPTASVPAKQFCPTYTKAAHQGKDAMPTYLNNCSGNVEVSQACSCLMANPTGQPKMKRFAGAVY